MERSKFLSLNWADFGKGLIIAVLSAIITFLYELLQTGGLVLDLALLQQIGTVALSALLAYILKNLFTNSDGQPFTLER